MARQTTSLSFESTLRCSRTDLWNWITDLRCLRKEMMPFLRMTAPTGIQRLTDVQVTPGAPLFKSWIFYLGFLPLDYSHITLLSLAPGQGFVEQSPMASMRSWRHEREILPHPSDSNLVVLRDTLTFEPRFFAGLATWLVRRLFAHRHAVLRREMGGT